LGFLGRSPFRREPPSQGDWISLDFLGFSRPNPDFSTGYADFSVTIFPRLTGAGAREESLRPRPW
jgi:hypothetical protein